MTQVRRGTVLSFNPATWTALVLLEGSDVESQMPVGQWVPATEMVANAEVAVLVFTPQSTNTDDGVVLGAYGGLGDTTTGTWTPAYAGSTTAGTFTYAIQTGNYILIGKLLYLQGRVSISAIGVAPVGTMRITGLPFAGAAYMQSLAFGLISNFNYSAAALQLMARIASGASLITLGESFDNSTEVDVPAANFTNAACDLAFSGCYVIA